MAGSGFERSDYLQCCKFAEGDSRILMQVGSGCERTKCGTRSPPSAVIFYGSSACLKFANNQITTRQTNPPHGMIATPPPVEPLLTHLRSALLNTCNWNFSPIVRPRVLRSWRGTEWDALQPPPAEDAAIAAVPGAAAGWRRRREGKGLTRSSVSVGSCPSDSR